MNERSDIFAIPTNACLSQHEERRYEVNTVWTVQALSTPQTL